MGVYKYDKTEKDGKKGKPKAIPSKKSVAPEVHALVVAERDAYKGQLDKLTSFLSDSHSKDIEENETAVELAIRLLRGKKPVVTEG